MKPDNWMSPGDKVEFRRGCMFGDAMWKLDVMKVMDEENVLLTEMVAEQWLCAHFQNIIFHLMVPKLSIISPRTCSQWFEYLYYTRSDFRKESMKIFRSCLETAKVSKEALGLKPDEIYFGSAELGEVHGYAAKRTPGVSLGDITHSHSLTSMNKLVDECFGIDGRLKMAMERTSSFFPTRGLSMREYGEFLKSEGDKEKDEPRCLIM